MSDATSFSKLGYGMLKKESPAGTAVYPDTAFELLSEDLKMNWDSTPADTIAGNRSANLRSILNKVGPAAGSIEILVEPKTIGHFFNGNMGEDAITILSASESYQHDWNGVLNSLPTYTIDIAVAGEEYVRRFFGSRIQTNSFVLDNNKLKAKVSIMAQKAFINARVTTAAAAGTTLVMDQTSGLTTSDSIQILDADNPDTVLATLTIAAVVSETTLTVSTIAASLSVNDIVVIKRTTPTYSLSNELIWSGGADVYAYSGSSPIQNLTAKTNCEGMEINLENEFEPRWSASGVDVVDRMPSAIVMKNFKAAGKITQLHTNPQMLDILRSKAQLGLRFSFWGVALDTNVAAAATGTIESDGVGTITVTVDATGEAGNDYAVKIVQGTTTLSVALSGKLITVTLDVTPANNAVATVTSAITALTGVSATSSGAGNVDTASNPNKIEFGSGRDANEKELLRFDFPNVKLENFDPNLSSGDVVNEEIPFTAYRDSDDRREVKVRLRNIVTGY